MQVRFLITRWVGFVTFLRWAVCWDKSAHGSNAGTWRSLCGGIGEIFGAQSSVCGCVWRVLLLARFCVWCDGVQLFRDNRSGSKSEGLSKQIGRGGVLVLIEFGVGVFDEWAWVEYKVGVTSFGLERWWFNLDAILNWSETESSLEKTRDSDAENFRFWSGLLLVCVVGVRWTILSEEYTSKDYLNSTLDIGHFFFIFYKAMSLSNWFGYQFSKKWEEHFGIFEAKYYKHEKYSENQFIKKVVKTEWGLV